MAQNPEASASAQTVCPACGQAVRASGAIEYSTLLSGRVPTGIVLTRLDAMASVAVQRGLRERCRLLGRSSAMNRARNAAEERLRGTIEVAEAIAQEAREQLEELATEREAMSRAALEMLDALLALRHPDARGTASSGDTRPAG